MKLVWKIAAMVAALNTSLSVTAQVTNDYIQNNGSQAQPANFWITGLGKFNNGLVLPKNGFDGILLGIRLTDLTETKGANFQLTEGTLPGLATWLHDGTNWVERMRILSNGFVGVGTTAPTTKLAVWDTSTVAYTPTGSGSAIPPGSIANIYNQSWSDGNGAHLILTAINAAGNKTAAYIGAVSNAGSNSWAPEIVIGQRVAGNSWTERLRIAASGNVGIGTTKPGAYKLAVEGTIRARRVKVDQETWADYVFGPEYKLPSLQEVEAFIKEHKHLPDVPSAEEVAREKLDLGEMNKILLQKIEELTLHLIEQEKEMNCLKERIKIVESK